MSTNITSLLVSTSKIFETLEKNLLTFGRYGDQNVMNFQFERESFDTRKIAKLKVTNNSALIFPQNNKVSFFSAFNLLCSSGQCLLLHKLYAN